MVTLAFWKTVGANDFILDVVEHGYNIPLHYCILIPVKHFVSRVLKKMVIDKEGGVLFVQCWKEAVFWPFFGSKRYIYSTDYRLDIFIPGKTVLY